MTNVPTQILAVNSRIQHSYLEERHVSFKRGNLVDNTLSGVTTSIGKFTTKQSHLFYKLLYRWVRSGSKEFSITREELADDIYACTGTITRALSLFEKGGLVKKRLTHTGYGENRRSHLHIDIDFMECCIVLKDRVYGALSKEIKRVLKVIGDCVFSALARTFCSPKKPQDQILTATTTTLSSVADTSSMVSTPSARVEEPLAFVEQEKWYTNDIESSDFAPALCVERAIVDSKRGEEVMYKPIVIKHNKRYAAALQQSREIPLINGSLVSVPRESEEMATPVQVSALHKLLYSTLKRVNGT